MTNNGTPTTFAVDGKNQLTSVGGLTCSYDNNGNLTSQQTGGSTHVYYTYDDENQLASVYTDTYGTPTGSRWRSDFTYDGRGRLRKRADYTWYTGGSGSWYPGVVVSYVYDGMRVIQERSGNTPTVAYTRGSDLSGSLEGAGGIGGLLARSVYSCGAWGSPNVYHADGNGNVVYLVNSAQARVAEYRYDPYGNLRYTYDSLPSGGNRYRFSSKEQMPNSGLYYYGYRFYDPNLQRWPNRDPVAEWNDLNLYRFLRNEPTTYIDPDGQLGLPAVFAALAIGHCGKAIINARLAWKCDKLHDEVDRRAREGLEPETYECWRRANRGQECNEFMSEAIRQGLYCGGWFVGRLLLIRTGWNPLKPIERLVGS
jgi:RHS repeat-associated protein